MAAKTESPSEGERPHCPLGWRSIRWGRLIRWFGSRGGFTIFWGVCFLFLGQNIYIYRFVLRIEFIKLVSQVFSDFLWTKHFFFSFEPAFPCFGPGFVSRTCDFRKSMA